MTTEAKKISVQELKQMVREAVSLQLSKNKESATDRRAKMEQDKEKANEGVRKVTVEQLRGMVKEAISLRLKEYIQLRENMGEMPSEGDLVAFHGKTGYVVQVTGDKVAITRDGIKMHVIPLQGVQVLATAQDLDELSPEELDLVGKEMGYNQNVDPGEDPHAELERISNQLDGHILSGPGRKALMARRAELKKQLGLSDQEPGVPGMEEEGRNPLAEEPYDRHEHGYLARMSWGEMPSDELWEKALQDGWHWRLGNSDRRAFDAAMEVAGLDPHEVEAKMGTPEGMKVAIHAMMGCNSEDPAMAKLCDAVHSLASSVMDTLGFEWV